MYVDSSFWIYINVFCCKVAELGLIEVESEYHEIYSSVLDF